MAVKTITIDMEAYEILASRKRPGQSFSQVIKERLGKRFTGRDLLAAAKKWKVSDSTLDAVDQIIRDRKKSLARAPKL